MEENLELQKTDNPSNYDNSKERTLVNFIFGGVIGFGAGLLFEESFYSNYRNILESCGWGVINASINGLQGRSSAKVSASAAVGYFLGRTLNKYKEPLLKILSQ